MLTKEEFEKLDERAQRYIECLMSFQDEEGSEDDARVDFIGIYGIWVYLREDAYFETELARVRNEEEEEEGEQ